VSVSESIPLEAIEAAFEGVIPATIATCSADGTPNVSYLSIVRRIDSERVAITNQFFTKTTANIRANPHVLVRVVHPDDVSQYDLAGRYLHSETSGELFESVRVQLDAIAAQTGMAGTFRLRSVDVIRVDRCSRVGGAPGEPRAGNDQRTLASLGVFVRRLAASRDLAEATRVGLESVDDLFGFPHSMVLLADEASQRLFVVAAHGYDDGRVGAEVAVGEGLIGVAAQRRQLVRVTNMIRSRTFAAAASDGDLDELPLRGLDDAQSVVAAPMMLQDRLVGVLYLDAARAGTFDARAAEVVDVVAGHLAVTIALLEAGGSDPADVGPPATTPVRESSAVRRVAFHESDGSVFVDGEYVIRGIPGRILHRLLSEHLATGRTQFSNKELRLDRSIELPAGNDNLEARLLVLRRRLAERDGVIAVERVGRGRIELAVGAPLELRSRP
jgi:adenylate cyclase